MVSGPGKYQFRTGTRREQGERRENGAVVQPNLHESAWDRAKQAAGRTYRTTEFGVVTTVVSLVFVSGAVLFTSADAPTKTQVAVPILAGLLALALCFGVVLAVQVSAAPIRQRDELRQAWKPAPVQTMDVPLTLRNAHRKGSEILIDLKPRVRSGFHQEDRDRPNEWADGVVELMAGNVPDDVTRRFIEAGRDESNFLTRLQIRLDELDAIIGSLDET